MPQAPSETEWTAILDSLTEQFKHRHHFFWSQYFKIFIYQALILLFPFSLLKADLIAPTLMSNNQEVIEMGVGALISLTALWIILFQSEESKKALEQEHQRVKKVHDALKAHLANRKVDLEVEVEKGKNISEIMISQYFYFIWALGLVCFFAGNYLFFENLEWCPFK